MRTRQGALSLSSLQPKFKFAGKGRAPSSLSSYQMFATNSMIEEFMLLANTSVAAKILDAFPSFAMLRRHPVPTKEQKCFKIDTADSKRLST